MGDVARRSADVDATTDLLTRLPHATHEIRVKHSLLTLKDIPKTTIKCYLKSSIVRQKDVRPYRGVSDEVTVYSEIVKETDFYYVFIFISKLFY